MARSGYRALHIQYTQKTEAQECSACLEILETEGLFTHVTPKPAKEHRAVLKFFFIQVHILVPPTGEHIGGEDFVRSVPLSRAVGHKTGGV